MGNDRRERRKHPRARRRYSRAVAVVGKRMGATERREAILVAAIEEFGERGFFGTSTEDIARRAGISQPYLFRLFGTKKDLFMAACARCSGEMLGVLQAATDGKSRDAAIDAVEHAFVRTLLSRRSWLCAQLHAFAAASNDPEIRGVVRQGCRDLVRELEHVAGSEGAAQLLAAGGFAIVVAALELDREREPWGECFLAGLTANGGGGPGGWSLR